MFILTYGPDDMYGHRESRQTVLTDLRHSGVVVTCADHGPKTKDLRWEVNFLCL